jgi:hypothetical protein
LCELIIISEISWSLSSSSNGPKPSTSSVIWFLSSSTCGVLNGKDKSFTILSSNEIEEILDNNWITNFEKEDKLYQDFYTDDNYFVHLHFIYIQKNMEIEKIREETFFMKTPNTISREEIVGLLKKNALIKISYLSILMNLNYFIYIINI